MHSRQRPVRRHDVGTRSARSSAPSNNVRVPPPDSRPRVGSAGFPGTAVVELVVTAAELQLTRASGPALVPAPEVRRALVEAVLVGTAMRRLPGRRFDHRAEELAHPLDALLPREWVDRPGVTH